MTKQSIKTELSEVENMVITILKTAQARGFLMQNEQELVNMYLLQ